MIPIPTEPASRLKQIPWVTITFALVYLLVLLVVQGADRQKETELVDWYQQSGLMKLEWNNYISWLRISGDSERIAKAKWLEKRYQQGDYLTVFRNMAFDPGFEKENLEQGKNYWSSLEMAQWKEKRAKFEEKADQLTTVKAGLTPTSPRPSTYLTYHFLHQNWLHLLLPTLLWLLFAMHVERFFNMKKLPLLYLGAGIFSGMVYVAAQSSSYIPLTGSTPIISATIGVFLAYYGRQKVHWVYFRAKIKKGGWFDQIHIHAAWFGLLWFLLPLFEHFMGSTAPNVWIAQIAGLVAGVMLYHITKDQEDEEEEEPEQDEDEHERLLRQKLTGGWSSLTALEFNMAAEMFEGALELDPKNFNALTGLYQVRKLNPDDQLLELATRIFTVGGSDSGILKQQKAIFKDLKKRLPEGAELPLELKLQLVIRFSQAQEFRDAEALLTEIMESGVNHPSLSKAAYSLSQTFKELGNSAKAAHYRSVAETAESDSAQT